MSKLDFIINKISCEYHFPKGLVLDAVYRVINDEDIKNQSAYDVGVIASIKNEFGFLLELIDPVHYDTFKINEEETKRDIVNLLDALMEDVISKKPDISHITDFDKAVDELSNIVQKDKTIIKNAYIQIVNNEIHNYKDFNKNSEIKKMIQDKIDFNANDRDVYDNAIFEAAMRFVINNKIQEIQSA